MTLAPPESTSRRPLEETSRVKQILTTILFGALCIVCSAALISFNKHLMSKGRFPFALPLIIIHMIVSFFCSCIGIFLFPSLFPSLTDATKRANLNCGVFFGRLLPIGVCFVGQLLLSNTAYIHSNVAFLQMIKEANIVLVYLLSLAVALERFRFRNMSVLLVVFLATVLTVKGELHFSLQGFALQGSSQLFEATKIVLQGVLLAGAGVKLDAFSYVLLMAPVCLVLQSGCLAVLMQHPTETFAMPVWDDLVAWWPVLLLNASLAYMLNVVTALFIKHSSAVAFVLMGVVKDAAIVLSGALVLSEEISKLQACGFALQLSAILVWSLMKSFPERFEEGLLQGLRSIASPQASSRISYKTFAKEQAPLAAMTKDSKV
mmetsp:Transcript_52750/g.112883  ORF Transcript_52750/g.112883 Transcript_52750/m.112883 type:complete len:376 (+) Transcript_52750:69-1196(+)